jgi:hypothetical protein
VDPKSEWSLYSEALWNRLSGDAVFSPAPLSSGAFFDLLDDQTAEDIAALWLQRHGWLVIPSSAKKDTVRYEFFLVSPETGRTAALQVKTGSEALDPSAYEDDGLRTYLFQTRGLYASAGSPETVCLRPGELLAFAMGCSREETCSRICGGGNGYG